MLKTTALPHALTERIVHRAGGNPFFIEEIVRSLIDQGAIILKERRFEVTEKVSEIPIPNTINDVLMARIDRLEEKTRHLLKVASVIGRNFFYRILYDVASEVEDIEGKLSHLTEKQLVQESRRMGEVEYLFKHALAQEVAYESIFPPKRRELHLKVAHSIEKIFKERLHEFYGMLAYHYSRAEDLEKAEEYLIKAGEEALRSSASDEALHYYKEALQLYHLKKHGEVGNPGRVAMLEKNIALALYNKGQYEESINYFDRALEYYWGTLPKNVVSAVFELLSSVLHFLIALYLPSFKFKRMPTQWDIEVIDLFYKKCKALAMLDPKKFLIQSLHFCRRITAFDLEKFENGVGLFVGASSLFSFSGISFRLSRKILDLVKGRVRRDSIRNYTIYELCETIHNFLEGNWRSIRNYDDDLVNRNCAIGEIFDATHHLYWHGFSSIFQGSFDIAESIVNRLDDVFKVYENDLSKLFKYQLKTNLLIERSMLHDALIESKEGIDFELKAGLRWIELYSCQAWIHVLMGDMENAERCLHHANENHELHPHAVPFELSSLSRSRFAYEVYRLKEAIRNGNRSELFKYRKKAMRAGRMLLKVAKKTSQHRTESYKLIGVYYWLINKQKKAIKWWHRAIQEGERLGSRPQLARVYFEVGRCLLESESMYKMLNRLKPEDYLEKAKILFEEMNLQSDLDELSQLAKSQGGHASETNIGI